MAAPDASRSIELLATMSHHANFSVGCYCADEAHCHRSVLRALLVEKGALCAGDPAPEHEGVDRRRRRGLTMARDAKPWLDPVAGWLRIAHDRDASGLAALLADEVVFHSPVVHTPQRGKAVTTLYLSAALQVFGNPGFRYVREVRGERDAVLEFELEIDGIRINGVDLLRWDDAGQVIDFKVMLRPLKAVHLIQQRMASLLEGHKP